MNDKRKTTLHYIHILCTITTLPRKVKKKKVMYIQSCQAWNPPPLKHSYIHTAIYNAFYSENNKTSYTLAEKKIHFHTHSLFILP